MIGKSKQWPPAKNEEKARGVQIKKPCPPQKKMKEMNEKKNQGKKAKKKQNKNATIMANVAAHV